MEGAKRVYMCPSNFKNYTRLDMHNTHDNDIDKTEDP